MQILPDRKKKQEAEAKKIENWDKDYILLKTEVDEQNRTANIKAYVPYNSLLLL